MSLLAVSISVNSILYAVLIVGGVGLFIDIALGIAGKFLSVEVDEKEVAIREDFRAITVVVADIRDVTDLLQQ